MRLFLWQHVFFTGGTTDRGLKKTCASPSITGVPEDEVPADAVEPSLAQAPEPGMFAQDIQTYLVIGQRLLFVR